MNKIEVPIDVLQEKCEHLDITKSPSGLGVFYVCRECGLGASAFLRDILDQRNMNEHNTK